MARVSVITIVKEHASGLELTHKSLQGQDFCDWEMVIVVGASTDGSLALATKFQSNDSRIRAIEQQGLGIYAAMNEGLNAAGADFIWFMNAGDRFAHTSVVAHAIYELEHQNATIIVGGYQIDSESKLQTYSYPKRHISIIGFAFNRRSGCHQAMIFRKQALRAEGGFNMKYSLAGDFDLVLKIIKKERVIRVPEVYALVEPGGRADQGIFLVHRQKHEIRREILGGPIVFIASILWTLLARVKIISRRTSSQEKIV